MSDTTRIRRPGARTVTGLALAATILTTAGVAAQGPSAATTPGAATAPGADQAGRGDHRGMGWRSQQRDSRRGGQPGFGDSERGWQRTSPARGTVAVTAVDGTNLALETADGWSRTIDTTGVALTRDGATIAIADILVGEHVRVVQTRNADGTYTVTGIEVQPATAMGTVGAVATGGFTVVGSDG
ncbi:MAG: hypothetical protein R3C32_15040, partial [Chloroflexota bacterium]